MFRDVLKMISLASIACLGATGPAAAQTANGNQPLDSVVAVVNDSVVLKSELNRAMEQARQSLAGQGRRLPPDRVLRKKVLQSLVMRRLQMEVADRMGVKVSDTEVKHAIGRIARQNHLNRQQLARAMRAHGMDYPQFKQRIHDELVIDKMRQEKMGKHISVSDHDIDLYLQNQTTQGKTNNSYHLSQILVAVPDNAGPKQVDTARRKTQGLLKQIRDGASFSRVAISHSDGQQAVNGGDMGWISADAMPTFFAGTVPQLETGQVSDIIRSSSGFHLVKLDGVRGGKHRKVTEYKLRHIMLKPSQVRSAAQTKAQIKSLYRRLQNGASFTQLARTYSDDDTSAGQGGNLGWHPRSSFPPVFANHLDRLHSGEVSQPFRTSSSWDIVKLLGRRKRDRSREMRRQQARLQIRRRKMSEQYQSYLRKLRGRAYINYKLDSSQIDKTSLRTNTGGAGVGNL